MFFFMVPTLTSKAVALKSMFFNARAVDSLVEGHKSVSIVAAAL